MRDHHHAASKFQQSIFQRTQGFHVQIIRWFIQQQQRRITPEERARIRAQYELDLYWPVRYTRWLVGWPQGPLVINGQEFFANVPVGCYLEATPEQGGGCADYVYLSEVPQLHPKVRSSRGIRQAARVRF